MKTLYKNGSLGVTEEYGMRTLWDGLACLGRVTTTKPHKPLSPYQIEIIGLINKGSYKRVLCIGGGACIIPTAIKKNRSVTIVEPNKTMIEIATQFFGFRPFEHNVLNCKMQDVELKYVHPFDCVVLDAYNQYNPDKELYCEEFYNKFKDTTLIVNEIVNMENRVWQRLPVVKGTDQGE